MAIPYAPVILRLLNGEIDTDSSNLKWTLHTSAYTPDRINHDFVNDLAGELTTANGYTVGGVAVVGSRTQTVANSWGTSRANSTAYTVGQLVRPATGNTFLYRCVVAGTSAASIPTYPVVIGTTVVDGGVTWECVGSAVIVLTTTSPAWATATFTGVRYAVLSQRDAGTTATQPLICYFDFVSDRAAQGGTFTVNPHAQGEVHFLIP